MDAVEIPLSRGMVALIDAEDLPKVRNHKWYASPNRKRFYAQRTVDNGKSVKMHREVMDAPPGMVVDHINGDGLDNRKENLRLVTRGQNTRHRADDEGYCKSKYYGVVVSISARITVNGERIRLGSFSSEEDAARAYDQAFRKYFPDETPPNGFS